MSETPVIAGEVLLTPFGVATAVSAGADGGGSFVARLWRVPGRSMASSAVATLRSDTIICRLPAAPGMVTGRIAPGEQTNPDGEQLLVHCYSAYNDTYLVSHQCPPEDQRNVAQNISLERVKSSELLPAKCARVYPLLHELMQRGNEASRTTREVLASPKVQNLRSELESKIDGAVPAEALSLEKVEAVSTTIKDEVSSKMQDKIPDAEEINAMYDMLKDEELTVLLHKGQERLRQLVSDQIPKATQIALRNAGIEIEQSADGAQAESASRQKAALVALDGLLAEHGDTDLATIKKSLAANFGTVFDTLAEASGSDQTLSSIFERISEQTSDWQAATGRLLSTRSVGVFMEGTARLQKRAAEMFTQPGEGLLAADSGALLTKAFTEGDVAVARLKSIELGDAVRGRLVSAIEVRSESQGGLDGIIAGALKTVKGDALGEDAQKDLQNMIADLQQRASSKKKGAHETLISILSQKSRYRDVALMRIEQVLIDLESHLGEEMSAEGLAALVSGEGGTAALFQPVARKAAQEIKKQLDAAEDSEKDPTMTTVLAHVRRIVSGELTMAGLVDEVASLLNDDCVVSAGEDLVKKGELVLDAFEGKSGSRAIDDVVLAAEKAGITKDAVMQHVKQLDMNSVLDTANSAMTDEKARHELLSSATDSALDFLLNILPSMPVPPLDGVKDGVVYNLSNLSLEGFKVKKEDITVEIAGIRAGKASENHSKGVTKPVKATELLTIDVKNIAAELDDACWSFEQTYLPYLKGGGMADSKLSEGSIRLQFELKRKRKEKSTSPVNGAEEWEPQLCLCNRSVSVGEVELVLQGDGKITWILNKLAHLLKGPLRDYVVRVIGNAITKRSGWLLENLNGVLAPYWSVVLRTAKLEMSDLAEVTEEDVIKTEPDPEADIFDLIFREQVPLGINLLLNDESGFVRVVDFPRGSQSRKVAQEKNLEPDAFKGATILSVNGAVFQKHEQMDVMEALRNPGRPKTIRIRLHSSEEAERVRAFAVGLNKEESPSDVNLDVDVEDLDRAKDAAGVVTVNIVEEGLLDLTFAKAADDFCLVVKEGTLGEISKGNILSHVNGTVVLGENGLGSKRALTLLRTAGAVRPLSLGFVKPYLKLMSFDKASTDGVVLGGPDEFVFEEMKQKSGPTKILLKSLQKVDGVAESSGVFIGDHLISVNGFSVGASCRAHRDPSPKFEHVVAMLRNELSLALTFARPKQEQDRWNLYGGSSSIDIESAETFCVTAEDYDQLGCEFVPGLEPSSIVVKKFNAVKGCVRDAMEAEFGRNIMGLCVESVGGQVLPSYASPQIVQNAIARSWPTEMLFANDAQREWVRNLASTSESEG